MEWFNKMVSQWNRVNPTQQIPEGATQAEALDIMEQTPDGVTEADASTATESEAVAALQLENETLEESNTALTAQVAELESGYVSAEVFNTQMQSFKDTLASQNKALATFKTTISQDINQLKAGAPPAPSEPPAPPVLGETSEEDDGSKDTKTINMKDLFNQSSVVAGI